MSDKITLHLLENSRAHRILWLLEELELPYELKTYRRNEENRADKALTKYNKLGKSPIVQIEKAGSDEKLTLIESGHIVNYLISEYDNSKKLHFESKEENYQIDFLKYFSEATVNPLIVQLVIFDSARAKAPYLKKAICNTVCSAIEDGYPKPELEKDLQYLEEIITANISKASSSKELFFVGDKLSSADILMSYGLISLQQSGKGSVFDQAKFSNLTRWIKSIEGRPAFKRASEKSKLSF